VSVTDPVDNKLLGHNSPWGPAAGQSQSAL
jgi:hypothetical protein